MEVTKPYKSIGVGAMEVTKPYKSIGLGAMEVTKPYKSIGFRAMEVTKPYKSIGFGALQVSGRSKRELGSARLARIRATSRSPEVLGPGERSGGGARQWDCSPPRGP